MAAAKTDRFVVNTLGSFGGGGPVEPEGTGVLEANGVDVGASAVVGGNNKDLSCDGDDDWCK